MGTVPEVESWNVQGYSGTHALCYRAPAPTRPKLVLFFILGNPGTPEYYDVFLGRIHAQCKSQMDLYTVAHKQIAHKMACMDYIVNTFYTAEEQDAVDFVLMAHSLGSYITLNILKERPHANITRCFLLFPTLHKIGSTPNGVAMTPLVFPPLRHLLASFIAVTRPTLSFISPQLWQQFVGLFVPHRGRDLEVTANHVLTYPYMNLLCNKQLWNWAEIVELDTETIKNNAEKLVLYYGTTDGWAPLSYHDEIRSKFPER
ncbi:hypothetical protein BJ742DRAFT_678565 [Cladochytrium replicatum]|nr:hypothetical protein BJ742DRAFT_678565 [Cladochytrium replicatum]